MRRVGSNKGSNADVEGCEDRFRDAAITGEQEGQDTQHVLVCFLVPRQQTGSIGPTG